MRLSSINWKKGFNRLFLIAAVGWVVYVVLIIPWQAREKELQTRSLLGSPRLNATVTGA
jgi:hypothetical protein